jgi:hypothetical protein
MGGEVRLHDKSNGSMAKIVKPGNTGDITVTMPTKDCVLVGDKDLAPHVEDISKLKTTRLSNGEIVKASISYELRDEDGQSYSLVTVETDVDENGDFEFVDFEDGSINSDGVKSALSYAITFKDSLNNIVANTYLFLNKKINMDKFITVDTKESEQTITFDNRSGLTDLRIYYPDYTYENITVNAGENTLTIPSDRFLGMLGRQYFRFYSGDGAEYLGHFYYEDINNPASMFTNPFYTSYGLKGAIKGIVLDGYEQFTHTFSGNTKELFPYMYGYDNAERLGGYTVQELSSLFGNDLTGFYSPSAPLVLDADGNPTMNFAEFNELAFTWEAIEQKSLASIAVYVVNSDAEIEKFRKEVLTHQENYWVRDYDIAINKCTWKTTQKVFQHPSRIDNQYSNGNFNGIITEACWVRIPEDSEHGLRTDDLTGQLYGEWDVVYQKPSARNSDGSVNIHNWHLIGQVRYDRRPSHTTISFPLVDLDEDFKTGKIEFALYSRTPGFIDIYNGMWFPVKQIGYKNSSSLVGGLKDQLLSVDKLIQLNDEIAGS